MKTKIVILMLFAIFTLSGFAFAEEIIVSVNDQVVENDGLIIMDSGVLYGLVSEFASHLDVDVKWLENAKVATLNIGGEYVSFKMDSTMILINNKRFDMENNAIVRDGRIYVPIEVLFEHLDIEHSLDHELIHVSIDHESIELEPSSAATIPFTEEDLLWLSRIIEVEARGGSVDKKTAVGNVVVNRVKSTRFPNSIYEVIFQKGQFPPAYKSGFKSVVPTESSVIAAKRALFGVEIAKDCLFFNYIPFRTKAADFYKLIEGDYFYY